ncbi:gamma-glutamylcyclotransferase [Stappia sp. F7233]|uniref:Gamma-glutamylcyclotransferase n=1 Tax=Stappia albiluteola TaxID=2758565 RepID=A0A839AGF8_9HYPH|nr:gamma-glutamylcyclotransferase family protein [Stappia albiluteola]MBA5777952.1 gamma-glutamylcyclotransferase [Stappia albiluteola]
MPLYFSYGANMSREEMASRCPGAEAQGVALLRGWRFVISGDGWASIERRPGSTVHGVLWELALGHVRALDRYEGVQRGWYEKVHMPIARPGGGGRALVYIGTNRTQGRPNPSYFNGVVLPAARAWGLPEVYVAELESWNRR